MADTITTTEEEKQPKQYESLWNDDVLKAQHEYEQQKEADDARIQQLSKGRDYWVGANMLANALGNLINVYGTVNGAPAMQIPDMDNSYMKVWKESDDIRRNNYQRLKDRYDRLRLAAKQDEIRHNDIVESRRYAEEQKQNQNEYNENLAAQERDRKADERNRNIEQVKALHPTWSDMEAAAFVDQKLVPESYRKLLEKEQDDRNINMYRERENAKQQAKIFYSGTGKDENNLYVSDGIGEDIIITGKDKSDKKKNIGLVSAIIKEKLDEMFPEVTISDIAKEKDESRKEELKKMKAAYDAFIASNKRTDWTNLDEKDIQYYIKKYDLLDEDMRHQLRQIAKSDTSKQQYIAPNDGIKIPYTRKGMDELYREHNGSNDPNSVFH